MYKKLMISALLLTASQPMMNASFGDTFWSATYYVRRLFGTKPALKIMNKKDAAEAIASEKLLVFIVQCSKNYGFSFAQGVAPQIQHRGIKLPHIRPAHVYYQDIYEAEGANLLKKALRITTFDAIVTSSLGLDKHKVHGSGFAYVFFKDGKCIKRHYSKLTDNELLDMCTELLN